MLECYRALIYVNETITFYKTTKPIFYAEKTENAENTQENTGRVPVCRTYHQQHNNVGWAYRDTHTIRYFHR